MRRHKKHGLLICGFNGIKVYQGEGLSLRIVSGRSVTDLNESDLNYSLALSFVTLRYQPTDAHENIKTNFLKKFGGEK